MNSSTFSIRCEWGEQGVAQLAPVSDVVIIVDVFSFSTAVEIATIRGATIYPHPWRDESAATRAAALGAELADPRGNSRYTLSPSSLVKIPNGARLVLPSPNGATLSLRTGHTPTLAGCLRNCQAVARAAQAIGPRIALIPAGERWPDGSLRPGLEDWIGAGAIISHLRGHNGCSPEAEAAVAAFHHAVPHLLNDLRQCSSGQELSAKGREADIVLAAELNVSRCVPRLIDGAYRAQTSGRYWE